MPPSASASPQTELADAGYRQDAVRSVGAVVPLRHHYLVHLATHDGPLVDLQLKDLPKRETCRHIRRPNSHKMVINGPGRFDWLDSSWVIA